MLSMTSPLARFLENHLHIVNPVASRLESINLGMWRYWSLLTLLMHNFIVLINESLLLNNLFSSVKQDIGHLDVG